ncbi:hypothetical protein EJ05DRAFT_123432 [Pseudovirgaria hyperparasitica]|uniref:Aminoacyl-transfer RNA synthetases class-II family profile domain-containing protein n=1 Tax=Pseudovirgaria hyperparasitica TaxID=470096 RepID=A0A6A6VY05_9PEZI|nr:uncharacterized protein EJ05DRAFT_123432 [Pseudovirgaria hyperparasitica]KAF2755133.1 hypothetical protein EJ05DRAFT_123432 [Pseudovirgaria hyperparasitica]
MSRHVTPKHSYIAISRFFQSGSVHSIHLSHRLQSSTLRLKSRCGYYSTNGNDEQKATATLASLEAFKKSLAIPPATHDIKSLQQLSKDAIKSQICVHGYIGSRQKLSKKLSFLQLQSIDLKYNLQVISFGQHAEALANIRDNSPVAIKGTLKERQAPKSETLAGLEVIKPFELELEEIVLLNDFPKDLIAQEETNFAPEQRHLQMRTGKSLRDALEFRSKLLQHCRSHFHQKEFMEVETPLLFKSTPEGAREFLVPTRKKGLAYALPQSPQQYKQILMASGIPRYFQIAKCFRDEDLRADRQPEFTQLDLEMSFVTGEDIMNIIEDLFRDLAACGLWKDLQHENLEGKFPRLTYEEAMAQYGSDKPDLRRGMKIHRVEHLLPADLISKISPLSNPIVEAMSLAISPSARETHAFASAFMSSSAAAPFLSNPAGQPGIFVLDPRKPLQGLSALGFEAAEVLASDLELDDEGTLLVLQARPRAPFAGGFTPLGNLRLALHKAAVAAGCMPAPTGVKVCWVTDFPLFLAVASNGGDGEPGQGGAAGICATHHPFTAPKSAADVEKLIAEPLSVRAEHYDIVVNGVELGGGSRRIHDAEMQEVVLRDVLQMSDASVGHFQHLLDVLRAGCPPHAGIALGLDRLVAVMLGKESVRDVIAFPKSGKGEDLLVKSPSVMTESQLATYHLKHSEA